MLMGCDWWILIHPVFLARRKRDEERKLVYTILTAPFSGGTGGGQEPGSNGGGRSTGGGRRGAQYFAIGKVCRVRDVQTPLPPLSITCGILNLNHHQRLRFPGHEFT